ncbi:MAG: hypothetical protein ACOYMN_18655, partial [Roseimicrobium sp.]
MSKNITHCILACLVFAMASCVSHRPAAPPRTVVEHYRPSPPRPYYPERPALEPPAPPPPTNYYYPKPAGVGYGGSSGYSGSSPESFQAVTPPASFSQ